MKKSFEFGSGKLRAKVGVIAIGKEGQQLKDLLGQYMNQRSSRLHVVMVRLGDDALAKLDQLVEAGIFASRSECAAFLIGAGIEGQKELFARLAAHTAEIRKLKEQLQHVALDALKPKDANPGGAGSQPDSQPAAGS